jgi:hypothetical protein
LYFVFASELPRAFVNILKRALSDHSPLLAHALSSWGKRGQQSPRGSKINILNEKI